MDAYDTCMERQISCQVFLIAYIFSIFGKYVDSCSINAHHIGYWIDVDTLKFNSKNEMFRHKVTTRVS